MGKVNFQYFCRGYEWFGHTPGHEALTAYGLQEFNEMKEIMPEVDSTMISRTTDWILKRRDGRGGFDLSQQHLDSFGRAPKNITEYDSLHTFLELTSFTLLPL